MSTAGGIGMRDFIEVNRLKSTLLHWAMLNAQEYNVSYPVWQPDNHVGEANFWKMLKAHQNIDVLTMCGSSDSFVQTIARPGSSNNRIQSLQCGSTTILKLSKFGVVIDASYEASVVIQSGISYAFGRESQMQYLESLAGVTNQSHNQFPYSIDAYDDNGHLLKYVSPETDPRNRVGEADLNVMAYSFRVCLTTNKSNSKPIQKPEGYKTSDFALAEKLLQAQLNHSVSPSLPFQELIYRSYPGKDKFDACCGFSPFGIDAAGLAVGYSNGTTEERERIYKDHQYYVKGLLWFWMADPDANVPASIRQHYSKYGICADEWPENGNFPAQLYVREAARLVGDRVFTQNDRRPTTPYVCEYDSIATADWGLDVHQMMRVAVKSTSTPSGFEVFNEGLTLPSLDASMHVYEIPYWILLPKRSEMSNLLVTSSPSISHMAYGSLRVEPTLWQLGQAAGIAAAYASQAGVTFVQDVEPHIIRKFLRDQGAVFQWPADKVCVEDFSKVDI
eukprot:TRINITY_DN5246_c0_g1_i1.p1 TRINITY_DN5246_c0_g1~~TRINITY_DN5246_c0_g1_i1.p1  ORF type:complete len:559 (-),score=135.72 TRINITY_DN5246_c0_g1_i1:90-1601(-)